MHLLQTLMGRGDSIAQNMQESLNEHKVPSLYFTLATTLCGKDFRSLSKSPALARIWWHSLLQLLEVIYRSSVY